MCRSEYGCHRLSDGCCLRWRGTKQPLEMKMFTSSLLSVQKLNVDHFSIRKNTESGLGCCVFLLFFFYNASLFLFFHTTYT